MVGTAVPVRLKAREYQAGLQALMLVAENGGPAMMAVIGVMQVLGRDHGSEE